MVDRAAETTTARAEAAALSIKAPSVETQAITLSGGNQQKVVIARSLIQRPRLVIFDEPTRGVDVGGRAAIHELLREAARQGQVVVFASSELDELLELGETIITMRSGRVIATYAEGTTREDLLSDLTHREGVAA
jgi:ABC-type sugar transport system ATPase subunit